MPRLLVVLTTAAALAGCSSGADTDAAPSSGDVVVKTDDATCELSAATAPAGTVTYRVTNAGSKVTEFYVYAEGDRVVGEAANIKPGGSRDLKVELASPGTFTVACKPGMVGDGIRHEFTVTGATSTGNADEKVTRAIAAYREFVGGQSDELVARTTEFVVAIKAGDVARAKSLYPQARLPWEMIEPVAESFGDLDPRIDGREDVVDEGMAFTGYHRLEKDLWVTGLQPDSTKIADQLLADVSDIAAKAQTVEPDALSIANGAKALLDEVATGKITGEEERYSHTDLWDFKGNLQGSQAALETLRPVVTPRDAALQQALDAKFAELNMLLDSHRSGGAYVSYTRLTDADVKKLTVALDALAEEVAKVPGVVAG
ncbi:hypothetical protein N864_12895 [Intrasporangium chromatireducens Q5-1]|uniref:Peptidase M75 n=2 Tax=Intrasporangium TaxID=53357 RepID=W9GLC1_9MICO|nr:hypothetical protein N864_12895 [Intrasporangium chromatireducens Q5-1]